MIRYQFMSRSQSVQTTNKSKLSLAVYFISLSVEGGDWLQLSCHYLCGVTSWCCVVLSNLVPQRKIINLWTTTLTNSIWTIWFWPDQKIISKHDLTRAQNQEIMFLKHLWKLKGQGLDKLCEHWICISVIKFKELRCEYQTHQSSHPPKFSELHLTLLWIWQCCVLLFFDVPHQKLHIWYKFKIFTFSSLQISIPFATLS